MHPVHGLRLSLAVASRAKDPAANSFDKTLRGEAHMAYARIGLTRAIHTWPPSRLASPAKSGQTEMNQYVEVETLLDVRRRTAAKPTMERTVAMGASLASFPHQSDLSEVCERAGLHGNIHELRPCIDGTWVCLWMLADDLFKTGGMPW